METIESRIRPLMITFFPMFIAVLSLLTSIYNGYLNNRFVDLIENNVSRLEYMRTCKEIIDAYFVVKVRAGGIATTTGPERERVGLSAAEAAAKFGALGTYLANLRDEATRERYTRLTSTIDSIVAEARKGAATDMSKSVAAADREFGALNEDCVRSAKAQRL